MTPIEFRKRFVGIMGAAVTPFKANGKINYSAFKPIAEYMLSNGVSVISPCGSTGEFASLTVEEVKSVIKKYIDVVKGRALVVPGVANPCLDTIIDLARFSKRNGADGILLLPPFYYKASQEELYQYYKIVDRETNMPTVIYNNPGTTKVDVEIPTQRRLYKLKNIVAIKESNGNLNRFGLMMDLFKNRANIIGAAEMVMLQKLLMGTPGFLSPSPNVFPRLMKDIFDAVNINDIKRAKSLFKKFWRYRMLSADGLANGFPVYLSYTKAAMEILGLPAGKPRRPYLPLSRSEYSNLKAVMKKEKLI